MLNANSFYAANNFAAEIDGMTRAERPLTDEELRACAPSIFGESAHESRSDRFAHVRTIEVVDAMRRSGFEPFAAAQITCRKEGRELVAKHGVRFRHPDFRTRDVGEETPEIILTNAHDGTASFALSVGVYRLVCANSLVAGDAFFFKRVRHMGAAAIPAVVEATCEVVGQTHRISDAVAEMKAIDIAPPEAEALAEAAIMVRYPDEEARPPITAAQALRARRAGDDGSDLWRTFNRVQENLVRGGARYVTRDADNRRRRGSTRPVKALDKQNALNKALWALAERMTELKAA